jgi:hypothetical protein
VTRKRRDKGDKEGEDAFADEKDLQLLFAVATICDDDYEFPHTYTSRSLHSVSFG